MAGLCQQFSSSLDRDVIDKTGITGKFDIHLELSESDLFPRAHEAQTDSASPAPSTDPFVGIQMAVAKLGLKLESTKAPREFLVIDHVEKPTEN